MSGRIAQDVELLAALFVEKGWDELRVEIDGVSLLLSNDRSTPSLDGNATPVAAMPPAVRSAGEAEPAFAIVSNAAIDPAWTPIVAPNLGTFYRSPKPGAAPFVELGQRVEPGTELCLLEVMKLFTSVQAGIAGIVRRIDAADAELVEGGQVLFHIEPART